MGKIVPTCIKYIIKAHLKAKGVVEKPDVIGALFGQTEGLVGPEHDLRELQRTGRLGRIEVELKIVDGNSEGEIIIPSALSSSETSLIAASLETIDRIGPCLAEIQLIEIEDARQVKKDYVINRAKDILANFMKQGSKNGVKDEIRESIRPQEITNYQGLPCGPKIHESDELIIVEGRADVLALLRAGIPNCIAVGGTSFPQPIAELAKTKTAIMLVDGDRGGELICKEAVGKTKIDYIATAPPGKEIEELGPRDIHKALQNKMPAASAFRDDYRRMPPMRRRRVIRLDDEEKHFFKTQLDELVGTRAACVFDNDKKLLGRVPVNELIDTLRNIDSPFIIIMDGKADYDLYNMARRRRVKFIVCAEKEDIQGSVNLISKQDLEL